MDVSHSHRPCTVSITSKCQKSTGDAADEQSQPIKFSTSKASHHTWKVASSMGSAHQQPWWRVLPFSILSISLLLWCAFRKDTEIDQALAKPLHEYLHGLVPQMEAERADEDTVVSTNDPETGSK
ncbi:protein CCSMST1 isoform X2 [Electrophorus electricus]|uniref:Uncharacterized protein n=1 Tax=Electrophorus electricus TaxID=8005 RepID=A0AAY5EUE9_ELEEL|nr:protein CCSMST1 isoform X2 [Electrophorus electricus]